MFTFSVGIELILCITALFFFNDTATTEIYTLSLHDALPIWRLHEARGDFDAAVRVAEREMYLSPEPVRKVSRGLEIGFICRDRLGNPTRALQAFKRVLELDPDQEEALGAAADLLAKLGRWKEHVAFLERLLGRLP